MSTSLILFLLYCHPLLVQWACIYIFNKNLHLAGYTTPLMLLVPVVCDSYTRCRDKMYPLVVIYIYIYYMDYRRALITAFEHLYIVLGKLVFLTRLCHHYTLIYSLPSQPMLQTLRMDRDKPRERAVRQCPKRCLDIDLWYSHKYRLGLLPILYNGDEGGFGEHS